MLASGLCRGQSEVESRLPAWPEDAFEGPLSCRILKCFFEPLNVLLG